MSCLSTSLEHNISKLHNILPIGRSFDISTRRLTLGTTAAYWVGINGMCRTEVLQQIFSDLQNPLYQMKSDLHSLLHGTWQSDTRQPDLENLRRYMEARIGYAQATLTGDWDVIVQNLLSGPSVLFVDGYAQAIVLDARTYPARGVGEPETERVTSGARDGFVETMLFNANLIRRRIRSPQLTFEIFQVGTLSRTDVAVAYVADLADEALLRKIKETLQSLPVSSLTLGSQSLRELLVPKKWFHPLPAIHGTQRPDTACSYLAEGHIALIVDNSPEVLLLPGNIFQFTQTPEDYYKSPSVGSYFRVLRFLCIPLNLLIMPVFLLLTVYYPQLAESLALLSTENLPGPTLVFYCFAVEIFLDLLKYSGALNSGRFSGALSIVGGLIIGDIAVELHWASAETFFYGAVTLLTSLALPSIAFADGLRIYRLFLLTATALTGPWGFCIGLLLIIISICTTPTFGGVSYLWPLLPFNGKALRSLLWRYPTCKAQPSRVWKR